MERDKGKMLVALLAKVKERNGERDGSDPEREPEDDDGSYAGDPGLESAMEDFARALARKDYARMASSFKDAMEFCHGEPDEDDEDDARRY